MSSAPERRAYRWRRRGGGHSLAVARPPDMVLTDVRVPGTTAAEAKRTASRRSVVQTIPPSL
jgi:hypothetical protein